MSDMIMRPSVFDEVVSLRDAVNNLFENSFLSPGWGGSVFNKTQSGAALNIYEDQTNFYIMGLFPGLAPEKLEVSVKENMLMISGEYDYSGWPQIVAHSKTETKEQQPAFRTLLNELPQGKFTRQIQLPTAVEFNKAEARYENGLLKLVLPKTERSQVKRITVQTGHTGAGQLVGASAN
jgi:HSP20 family protein